MAASQQPLSFCDSANSSSICYADAAGFPAPTGAFNTLSFLTSGPLHDPTTTALRLLSNNLETLFNTDFCSDASISAPSVTSPSPRKIPVHRCVLSARSSFFRDFFSKKKTAGMCFEMKDLAKEIEVSADALMLVLGYIYTGRVGKLPEGVCVCSDVNCRHVGCRPAVDFMLEVLYASFVFQISELVSLFQRHLVDIIKAVSEDDILVVVTVANLCKNACERLLSKCIEILVFSKLDFVTLEKTLPPYIVKEIMASRSKLGQVGTNALNYPNKHVKRIHRALDSDDVELVRMLLKEDQTTLDDAYALHYAVLHCDSKIVIELLDLGIADINHRNPRGYTVLHVAALRREPKIIVSLLTKGAHPSDTTMDGRKALQISRRLTKLVDYNRPTEEGRASHKDRLCIEVLENAETNHPIVGEAAIFLSNAGDDLRSKLLYLENRVGIAKHLFPMEAKIAMGIAKVDGTMEFTTDTLSNMVSGSQGAAVDDLNEIPFRINQELLSRMNALSKTVEVAKRYFPRCAKVLDELMDNDTEDIEIAFRGNDNSDEKKQKRKRYQELQDAFSKAFYEDKEDLDRASISSSSSSTMVRQQTKMTWR